MGDHVNTIHQTFSSLFTFRFVLRNSVRLRQNGHNFVDTLNALTHTCTHSTNTHTSFSLLLQSLVLVGQLCTPTPWQLFDGPRKPRTRLHAYRLACFASFARSASRGYLVRSPKQPNKHKNMPSPHELTFHKYRWKSWCWMFQSGIKSCKSRLTSGNCSNLLWTKSVKIYANHCHLPSKWSQRIVYVKKTENAKFWVLLQKLH
jgi:hypothetical protein